MLFEECFHVFISNTKRGGLVGFGGGKEDREDDRFCTDELYRYTLEHTKSKIGINCTAETASLDISSLVSTTTSFSKTILLT